MRAAIYARYSTANQNERSLQDQIDRCRRWAAKNGHDVVATFEDAAISGTTLARPALDQLREGVKRKKFDVVLLDEVTRISRDIGGLWNLVFGEFQSAGILVVDCLTGMDSSNPNVQLTWGMSGLVSTMMIATTKAKTHGALEKLSSGGFHAGGPCYGFRSQDEANPTTKVPRKSLAIHEPEAETIREIFRKYIEGDSCRTIANDLSTRGVPAPRTGSKKWASWGDTTVRFILKNRRYLGEFTWNARRFVKDTNSGKRKPIARPPSEHIVTTAPQLAIVDQITFAKAAKKFRPTGGRPEGSTTKHPPHPLKGLIKCHSCGGSMTIYTRLQTGTTLHTFVRCSTNTNRPDKCDNRYSVSIDRVIDTIYDAALEQRRTPENLEKLVAEVLKNLEKAKPDPTNDLKRELSAAKARAKNLLDAIATLGLQPDIATRYKAEQARISELESQLADVRPQAPPPTKADVLRILEGMEHSSVRALDPQEVAEQLRQRFEQVTMEPHEGGWKVRAFVRYPVMSCSGGPLRGLPDIFIAAFLRRSVPFRRL